jgi:hypothetical protein
MLLSFPSRTQRRWKILAQQRRDAVFFILGALAMLAAVYYRL